MDNLENQSGPDIRRLVCKIIGGGAAAALFIGVIFFFTYFKVEQVEVTGSSHYSDEEIRGMVLRGPLASNSILAPMLYSAGHVEDVPFVDSYKVTRLNKNAICISVREKDPVGCIPYLDSYVYFDRNGIFIESSLIRDESVPYFDGIQVSHVIKNEKLPIKGNTVLNTAVALAMIFEKNQMIPDHIQFDQNYQINLLYGDVTVQLGKDSFLEDKMARVLSILPLLEGERGILHLEGITETQKRVTFEREQEEITAENWPGGYDENGDFTGDGEYDENGKHVGPKPKTELDYALEAWPGGYDEEGDYTGAGEYDEYGNYVGPAPTSETMEANGGWLGGYDEDGRYIGYGQFDREGNYVGPNPNGEDGEDEDLSEEDWEDAGSDGEYYGEDAESYEEDYEDGEYYGDEESYDEE